VTRAAGVKGYGGGSLDQGDGSNRVPAASGGAPACGGGRGRDGQVDRGDGISDTVHPWGPREPSDQTHVAQIGPGTLQLALPVPELVAGRGRGTARRISVPD